MSPSPAMTKLGEITEIVMGQAPPGTDCNTEGRGQVFVKAGEFDERRPIIREWTTNPLKLARRGDVLVCVVGATAGKINEAIECAIGRSVAAVRPKTARLLTGYLYHFLRTQVSRLRAKSQGMAQGVITREMLQDIAIPLPPLPEQRRIAEILDKADALRSKRRAAVAQLDTLTQSIFPDMFGDPATNLKRWQRLPLIDLCSKADDIKCGPFGTQLTQREYTSEGVPLWGIKNVNAFFRLATQEFLDPSTAKRLSQYSIEPGDIVMTRKGTIGNCAVYPADSPLGIMHSDLLRLRVHRERSEPNFVAHQLHYSSDVERQIALISGGAIMPGINVTKLKTLKVIVPPVHLQREFTNRLLAVERLKAVHVSAIGVADTLFASLQHRAYRGEL